MTTRGLLFGLAVGAGALYVARGVGVFGEEQGAGVQGDDVDNAPPSIIDSVINMATNTFTAPTSLSDRGLQMLMGFEGFSATPYSDYKGNSIGYGHLIKAGETLTHVDEAQAAVLLRGDVAWAERAVTASVRIALTQDQFDALVSLCFNIGETAFKRSTLVRLLNEGDYSGAADQFAVWRIAGGQVHSGLVARRAVEAELFRGGIYA